MKCVVLKPLGVGNFSHSSEMKNYALMYREGLTLAVRGPLSYIRI